MNLLHFDHNFYHLHINVIIFVSRTCSKKPQFFPSFFLEKVHVPNFGGVRARGQGWGEAHNSIQFNNIGRVGYKSFKEC